MAGLPPTSPVVKCHRVGLRPSLQASLVAGSPVFRSRHSKAKIKHVCADHTRQSNIPKDERQALGSGSEIYKTGFEDSKLVLARTDQATKTQCAVTRVESVPLNRSKPKMGGNKSVANEVIGPRTQKVEQSKNPYKCAL